MKHVSDLAPRMVNTGASRIEVSFSESVSNQILILRGFVLFLNSVEFYGLGRAKKKGKLAEVIGEIKKAPCPKKANPSCHLATG